MVFSLVSATSIEAKSTPPSSYAKEGAVLRNPRPTSSPRAFLRPWRVRASKRIVSLPRPCAAFQDFVPPPPFGTYSLRDFRRRFFPFTSATPSANLTKDPLPPSLLALRRRTVFLLLPRSDPTSLLPQPRKKFFFPRSRSWTSTLSPESFPGV